jgi:hypothetical protein
MSTTMQTPEVGVAPPVHRHLTTVLWVVVGVLAAALVALGAWVIVDRYTGPEYDAAATIDDLASAWSNGDEAALRSLYAPNAVQVTGGGTLTGVGEIVGQAPQAAASDFTVERIAPVTTEGEFATTYLRYSYGAGEQGTVLDTYQIQDGKIVRHWSFEPGVTAPFDNAVVP